MSVTKKGLAILIVGIGFFGTASATDSVPQTKEQITKEAMRANKKALVAHNMNLTPDQEKIFWPMYDEYQVEINKLMADREAVVQKFSINYNNMSDQMASQLLDDEITLEKKEVEIRKSLINKFEKSFPPKVVARYFQIENKVDMAIMADASSQIPLVK